MGSSLISRNPDVMSGSYVIRGRRITTSVIKACYREGWSVRRIVNEYRLTEKQVRAALNFRKTGAK